MTAVGEVRLTRAQLEAWSTFGREWGPFKEAWLARGFRLPPAGSAEDDDERPSQRSMLFQVVDAWPTKIAEWVREAPGRTPHEVTAHVLRRWHAVRDAVGPDEEDDEYELAQRRERGRREATEALSAILGRIRP